MVNLIEKIDNANELIDFVNEAQDQQKQNQEIASTNNKFFKFYNEFSSLVKSCVNANFYFNFKIRDSDKIKIKSLLSVFNSCFKAKKVNTSLDSLNDIGQIKINITQDWTDYFCSNFHGINDDLSVLYQISDKIQKAKIKNIQARLNKCENWPLSKETCLDYQQAKIDADELLNTQNFNEDIKQFLKKVSKKTATLNDLTPAILDWIKKNNMSENIILSIKI